MKAAPFCVTAALTAHLEFGRVELRDLKDSALPSSRARLIAPTASTQSRNDKADIKLTHCKAHYYFVQICF